MDELKTIKETIEPSEVLLVVDLYDRTRCCNVAKSLNEQLDIRELF